VLVVLFITSWEVSDSIHHFGYVLILILIEIEMFCFDHSDHDYRVFGAAQKTFQMEGCGCIASWLVVSLLAVCSSDRSR
jgi:hypothetical protein